MPRILCHGEMEGQLKLQLLKLVRVQPSVHAGKQQQYRQQLSLCLPCGSDCRCVCGCSDDEITNSLHGGYTVLIAELSLGSCKTLNYCCRQRRMKWTETHGTCAMCSAQFGLMTRVL